MWDERVGRQEEYKRELNLYRQGPVFQSTLADVTIRLGFQYNMSSGKRQLLSMFYTIKFTIFECFLPEDMLLIYDMCRYQKAWNLEQVSPWCAAFTSENLKVLCGPLRLGFLWLQILNGLIMHVGRLWNMGKTWKLTTSRAMGTS